MAALEISIPCSACATPIRFGERTCSGCHAAVSPRTRAALEARLEHASADFRELTSSVATARVILVVVAGIYIVLGVAFYLLRTHTMIDANTPMEVTAARVALVGNLANAALLLGCFAWSRRAPTPALITALVLCVAVQALTLTIGGFEALGGLSVRVLVARVITFALLLRGLAAAIQAARLRAALVPITGSVPAARVIQR